MFDIWNKRYLSNYTRSRFVCPRAENEDWDLVDWTGGYSPRNEAYVYASHFVDMWRELIGNDIQPYSECRKYQQLLSSNWVIGILRLICRTNMNLVFCFQCSVVFCDSWYVNFEFVPDSSLGLAGGLPQNFDNSVSGHINLE